MKNSNFSLYLDRLKWIFLGGGAIFFLVRAIWLASTGGGCLGTIIPIPSWILLFLEINLSGIAGSAVFVGLIFWIKNEYQIEGIKKENLSNIILYIGLASYVVHFIRVSIWLIFCVL